MDIYCNHCSGSSPKYLCRGCEDAWYCDRECQIADWNHGQHREYCKEMMVDDFELIEKKGGRSRRTKLSKRQQQKFGTVMREFKQGRLHSGGKKGPIVKSRKQALAIAYSEARKF